MRYDVVIIGGGIVGCATAMALLRRNALSLAIVEKEADVGTHQSGHNSGVIHAGLYYKPGSLKATLCTSGRLALVRFCDERKISWEPCGKLVIATRPEQLPRLDELERRGRENGLTGIVRLNADEIREHEPHAAGLAGLHVPETGIVDYARVTAAYADEVRRRGGDVRTFTRVLGIVRDGPEIVVETTRGELRTRCLVNCAGLHSDRIARMAGMNPALRIVPFRGEYYELVAARRSLVRSLIYPVPNPAFPFLGVHFTRRIDGAVEAGPNAVLALKREGYTKGSLSIPDALGTLSFAGFRKMAARHWKVGLGEMWRSLSKRAFVAGLAELVPAVREDDLVPAGAGVRAQAVLPDGTVVDDFHIEEGRGMIHVLNAPSPAATASISIGEAIADRVMAQQA